MHATNTRQLADPRVGLAAAAAAIIFAAGIVFGSAMDLDAPDAEDRAAPIPVGDRSYDALEETRSDRGLSVPVGDRRYDAVEETRLDAGRSVPLGDRRYDAVEETRAERDID